MGIFFSSGYIEAHVLECLKKGILKFQKFQIFLDVASGIFTRLQIINENYLYSDLHKSNISGVRKSVLCTIYRSTLLLLLLLLLLLFLCSLKYKMDHTGYIKAGAEKLRRTKGTGGMVFPLG
jgi:hypothetical protein